MAKHNLTIEKLGALGDGISTHGIFVPYGLPGETVNADVEKGRAIDPEWTQCAPERIDPVCAHFGDCGGCKAQHMDAALYARWKTELVADALAQAGIETNISSLVACAPNTRRRVVFSVVVKTDDVDVGLQRAGSNHVVAITECHVITKRLEASRAMIGALAKCFLPRGHIGAFTVLDSRTGFDVAVNGDFTLSNNDRRAISAFAMKAKIARISVNNEIIIENAKPVLDFSGFKVAPPSGAFVQAVKSAEEAMVQLVCNHLSKCKRVADLFCGSGTFALPLARTSSVYGAEGEPAALAALDHAWRDAAGQGLKPIKTEKRDLYNRPLMAKEMELQKLQGVVFDPPRVGAEMQARELAKSKVKRIAAVSCNPVTLARDLKILIDGGYTLQSVTPLDQFLWSPHVEAVALLVRGKG